MNNINSLNLEIFFSDLLYELNIKTGEELSNAGEDLHDILENALQEYADGNNLSDDYEPSY